MLGRDTRTVILDLDHDRVIVVEHTNHYSSTGIGVPDRIIKQIGYDLSENRPICFDFYGVVSVDGYFLCLLLGQDFEKAGDILHERNEADVSPLQLDLAGVRARDGQKAVYKASKTCRLFQHACDDFSIMFGRPRLLKPHFTDTANRGEGCPQLM